MLRDVPKSLPFKSHNFSKHTEAKIDGLKLIPTVLNNKSPGKRGIPTKSYRNSHPSPSLLSALQRSNFTILQWLGSPDNLRNGVVFLILSLSYQLYRWCFSSATAAMTQMHHKNVWPVCHLPLILQWQDTWTALHFPADPSPGGRIRSESGGHLYKLHTLQFHYHSKKPTNQPNLL